MVIEDAEDEEDEEVVEAEVDETESTLCCRSVEIVLSRFVS